MSPRPCLALTMGEPGGIGADISLTAWAGQRQSLPPFFILDDPDRLRSRAQLLDLEVEIETIENPARAPDIFTRALPVMPLSRPVDAKPGQLDPAHGPMVTESIDRAVGLALDGQADAVVTNPIHKHCLQQAGFSFPGHTEYLASLAGLTTRPVMMLACAGLRVIPVTIHLSLADAVRSLSKQAVIETALIAEAALREDFAVAAPRIAVAGLNPHAGEGGAMGDEDNEIIAPAVADLRSRGIDARGPLPADTLFHAEARAGYDLALCMYHDQALIPIKTIAFDEGVNVTLGLPFVRTSPDHGTAIDLAGSGKARATSLIAALHMAATMAEARARTR